MDRRNFIANTTFMIPAVFSVDSIFKLFVDNPWKIQMLNKTTGIFTEKGGTILFKLTKVGIVVIDSQFPDQADHLIAEVKKISNRPFELLIHTHHHGDHTSGSIKFKGLVNRVLAHENSKTNQVTVAQKNNNEDKQLYPTQTYSNTWSEKIGNDRFSLHYFGAGHTNGDSLIHLEKDHIVHMGDLLFNRRHPFVDRSAGARMNNWIKVLDQALATFPSKTTYIFGHSGEKYPVTGNAADLTAFKNYIDAVLQYVKTQIDKGVSKEELLKTTEIPGAPAWTGDGISRPLTAAYEELTMK